MWGGGIGPTDGTNGTTITSGVWSLELMMRSFESLPINIGFLGKGNCSGRAPLDEQLAAGAAGLKIHEDWGATPSVIRAALSAADDFDVQVSIHTDTLNESGFVEDTIAAFEGRTIHTFHTEGAGGGHAPDIMKVAGELNVLPSSTNPTLPYGINSQAELYDMIMVCHNLNPKIPSDVSFAESRVRAETIAAENVLHDMGVISMISSDSQAMGRIGENWLRAIQTADAMKAARGSLPEDAPGNDNFRVLRFVAKVTINPAITQGISHVLGSVEPGKMADLVLWEPAFFGAKPKMVIKGGLINWAADGRPERVPADAAAGHVPADVRRVRRRRPADLRDVRVPRRLRRRRRREAGPAPPGDAGVQHPHAHQARHGAQRRDAAHRGQPRDVRGQGGREARHRAAGRADRAQPALLLQLGAGRKC